MRPHYVTTPDGQIRLWLDGAGPTLVAVSGAVRAASIVCVALRAALPGWRVIVVEPPGLGGSAAVRVGSALDMAAQVGIALEFLAGERFTLAACDLSIALLPHLVSRLRPERTVLIDPDAGLGWVEHGLTPPDLAPREDGTHLNSLWSFIRDRRIVRPDDPRLPIASGAEPPDVEDLAATFVAAAVMPESFSRFWHVASAAYLEALNQLEDDCESTSSRPEAVSHALGSPPAAAYAVPPPTAAAPGVGVWHQYLDTASGRAHLRRAGSSGAPLLVLPTGGGSSAQFAPVLRGLADTRTVVAVDYFGNGLSESLDRIPDAADLAREALAVVDALGWDDFDVWGSHTGACVALELAVVAPERIRRAVLEAPVMMTATFRDEILANYFPDFTPDQFGRHLQHVWNWRRDMFLYWPWYRMAHATARSIGIPSAADLHPYCVGILESGTTYDRAYRAGFGYDTPARLPALQRPAMLTAGPNDMLANALADSAALAPAGMLQVVPTPATVWWPDPDPVAAERTLQVYREFLR